MTLPGKPAHLHELIAAVCPIEGVGLMGGESSAGLIIRFRDTATKQQRDDAQAVVDAFDWSDDAQETFTTEKTRAATKAAISDSDIQSTKIRAILAALVDHLNVLHAKLGLTVITLDELIASVGAKVDSGAVDAVAAVAVP